MRVIVFLLLVLGLWSCSKPNDTTANNEKADSTVDAPEQLDYESLYELDTYLVQNVDAEEIQTIDFNCAIIVYPTEEQLTELQNSEGEDAFNTIADDAMFYQSSAIGLIDSVGVKTIEANGQFLRLVGSERSFDLDIRKKNLPEWNIIFFNTKKDPRIISAIELTIEGVWEYFDVASQTDGQ